VAMSVQLLLGNDAIALGMVHNDCRVVTAYPGTPSSEILAGVVKFKQQLGGNWRLGIIASGVAFATAQECLSELGVALRSSWKDQTPKRLEYA